MHLHVLLAHEKNFVEPQHKMYWNDVKGKEIEQERKVEPQHKMYWNVFRRFKKKK